MTRLLVATATAIAAVVMFVLLRPENESSAPATSPATTETAPTTTLPPPPPRPPSPAGPARVRITVRGGVPVGGIRRVTVGRGRRVILTVMSDVSDHVHLHGYDVVKDVGPGMPARLPFRATIRGTVEVELEDRRVPLATITAQ
jgi:hypothetical protein